MTAEDTSAYDRGRLAGEVAARLAGHDQHFESINGSLDRFANELGQMRLQMQRIADAAAARELTLVTTAQALKESAIAQREAKALRWAPWQKIAVALTVLTPIAALIAYILISGK